MTTIKPGDIVRFFWMGEWHIGTIVRFAGISLRDEQSMYEVANDNLHLFFHPTHLIEPINHDTH